jgi:DNA-nicking Smr family endonuclease
MKFKQALSSQDKHLSKEAFKKAFKPVLSQPQNLSSKVISNQEKQLFKQALLNQEKKLSNQALSTQEQLFFKQAIGKVKPMQQDKIQPFKKFTDKRFKATSNGRTDSESKQLAQFHFSDEFEPDLNDMGPMKYCRHDVDSFETKNLRRGQYAPDLILDLHGLDQHQAKQEIAALLYACQKEHAQCVCIVHGIGARILKTKVPHWLVQHPDVMAFHQAPLEWGGKGALLALIELKDKFVRD